MGDLLELIYNARKSFTTLQTTVRVWRNEEAQAEASRRYQASRPAGSVVFLGPRTPRDTPEVERFYRLWAQPPSRWRYENHRADGAISSTTVVNGDRWWSYNPQAPPQMPAVTTNVRPDQTIVLRAGYIHYQQNRGRLGIYDPSLLLLMLSLERAGRATHAGREAIRVKAWPRDDIDLSSVLEILWFGADEYEFLVDAQRGTMLRTIAWIDGRELAIEEVTSVVFDEVIPEDVFEFTPPAGVRVQVIGGDRA